MKPPEENGLRAPVSEAEKTLRLVATLPAPQGLADRVQDGLEKAPHGRMLEWPMALMPGGTWMMSPALRGAAAAAIVCIVAGGGWRIYSHVQTPAAPTATVVTMPARVGAHGAFSNSGAMHTPDSLAKPVLTHAVAPDAAVAPEAAVGADAAAPHAPSPAKRHKIRHRSVLPAQPLPPR